MISKHMRFSHLSITNTTITHMYSNVLMRGGSKSEEHIKESSKDILGDDSQKILWGVSKGDPQTRITWGSLWDSLM